MKKYLIFILPVLLLSACAQVSYPEKDLKARLNYNELTARAYKLDQRWWKVYNDPQLDYLMDMALANNPDLAKAAVKINRAMYQAKLIGADLLPSFSGKLDASAKKNIDEGGASIRSAGGSVSISYELDLWRKLADSSSAADWEHKATIEDLESARLLLIASVVDAYYYLAYLNGAVKAAEENVKNYAAIADQSGVKYKSGKTASIDFSQSQQSLLSAQNNLINLENQRKSAEASLRNLLNIGPDTSLAAVEPGFKNFKAPKADLDIPLPVLANRPDLRAAEFRLRKAFSGVEAAEKNWLPSISISSAVASSGTAIKNAFNAPAVSGLINVALPFLDWSTVYYNLRISEADFESARIDFEKALINALNEADTSFYSYSLLLKSLAANEKKLSYDIKISNHYKERYRAGAGEKADWLNALAAVNNSHLNLLKSQYDVATGAAKLYRSLGGRYSK